MSHVEAITGSQTSTFAFMPMLKIIKSAQLVTVTSCTYLSKSVYYTLKSQEASDSEHESKPRNLRPEKKVYTIHSKAKGLPTPNTSRSQETFGQKKKCILYTQKPRGSRLQTRVEAKKPLAKKSTYYTLKKPRGF